MLVIFSLNEAFCLSSQEVHILEIQGFIRFMLLNKYQVRQMCFKIHYNLVDLSKFIPTNRSRCEANRQLKGTFEQTF